VSNWSTVVAKPCVDSISSWDTGTIGTVRECPEDVPSATEFTMKRLRERSVAERGWKTGYSTNQFRRVSGFWPARHSKFGEPRGTSFYKWFIWRAASSVGRDNGMDPEELVT